VQSPLEDKDDDKKDRLHEGSEYIFGQYPFLHPIVVLLYTKGTKIPSHTIYYY
jgi:hypothetical protein